MCEAVRAVQAHEALLRALRASGAVVLEAEMTRWRSATFAGVRHRVGLTCDASTGLAGWLKQLGESLRLPGHLVADLEVESVERDGERASVDLAVLTVDDR